MRSDEMHTHCVLQHDTTSWPPSLRDRTAIESAMSHLPALIALVAACERRQLAVDERRVFGESSYREDPFSICTTEFREHAARLDRAVQSADREINDALAVVHAVETPSAARDATVSE